MVSCQFGESMTITSGEMFGRGVTVINDQSFVLQGSATLSGGTAVGQTSGNEYVWTGQTTQIYKNADLTEGENIVTNIEIHRLITGPGGQAARFTQKARLVAKPTGEVVVFLETIEENPPC